MKRTSFLSVLKGLVGLHRSVQLWLLQRYWLGHRLGLPWYWMVCLGNEQRSFCQCKFGAYRECHLRFSMCLLWGGWSQAATLLADVNCAGSQKVWLATGTLLTVWWRMPSLGPRLSLTFWLWLPHSCLSASGGGWAGLQLLALLWYSLSPLFCEWPGSALGYSFWWESSVSLFIYLFFFSLWLSCSLACYLMLVSSDCPKGIQSGSLP